MCFVHCLKWDATVKTNKPTNLHGICIASGWWAAMNLKSVHGKKVSHEIQWQNIWQNCCLRLLEQQTVCLLSPGRIENRNLIEVIFNSVCKILKERDEIRKEFPHGFVKRNRRE